MNRIVIATALAVFVFVGSSLVLAQSEFAIVGSICSVAFEQGISDNYELLTDQTQYALLKSLLIQHRFSSYDQMVSVLGTLKFPIPIADGLLNLEGGLDAKQKHFSKNYEDFLNSQYNESYYRNFMQQRKSEVSRALTDAWQACIKTVSSTYLDQKGILIGVAPFDAMRKFTVDIKVRVPAGQKPRIVQIAPAGEVACESATGSAVPPGFIMPLPEYTLTCTKDATKALPFSITVDPGGLAKRVTVPQQVDRITELVGLVHALQAELAATRSQFESSTKELAKQIGETNSKIPTSIALDDRWQSTEIHHSETGECPAGYTQTGSHLGISARDMKIVCRQVKLKH